MDIKHVFDPLYPPLATNGQKKWLSDHISCHEIMIDTFGSNLEVNIGYYLEINEMKGFKSKDITPTCDPI